MNKLKEYRKQIDEIDQGILNLLANRFNLVKEIGEYKRSNNIPPLDPDRWESVISVVTTKAKSLDLSTELIKRIWNIIHEYSLKVEQLD